MSSIDDEREKIEAAWDELSREVDALGSDGLAVTGPDGWAVKDHLSHIAAWELSLIALLEGRDRLIEMGIPGVAEDTDSMNYAIWKLHQDASPDEALNRFRETHELLLAAIGNLSDDDLERPYSHFQPADPEENSPVAGWIAGDTYEHYAGHLGWIKELTKGR